MLLHSTQRLHCHGNVAEQSPIHDHHQYRLTLQHGKQFMPAIDCDDRHRRQRRAQDKRQCPTHIVLNCGDEHLAHLLNPFVSRYSESLTYLCTTSRGFSCCCKQHSGLCAYAHVESGGIVSQPIGRSLPHPVGGCTALNKLTTGSNVDERIRLYILINRLDAVMPVHLWSLTNRLGNRGFGFQPDVSGQPRRHAGGDDLRERRRR